MAKPPPSPIQVPPKQGWHRGPLVAGDTETDSPEPRTARLITATMVRTEGGKAWHRCWVAKPERPIPDEAAAVHGYPTERAEAEGSDRREVLEQIEEWLGTRWTPERPLIMFNAAFDLTLIDRELRREFGRGLDVRGPVMDPFVIDKQRDKYRPGERKLGPMCVYYSIPFEGAHDALADTFAAGRLFQTLGDRWASIRNVTPAALHDAQVAWKREQAESLLAYWRKNPGNHPAWRDADEVPPQDVIDGWTVPPEWPLIPYSPDEETVPA